MGPIVPTSLNIAAASDQRSQTPISAEQALFNRSVAGAASEVNASGLLGENREVTFAVDPASHKPVIKILDVNTNEVIDQWPPEYLLQLAAQSHT